MRKNKIQISKIAYGENQSSMDFGIAIVQSMDLYPSERYFLEPALKNIVSVLDVGQLGGSFNL